MAWRATSSATGLDDTVEGTVPSGTVDGDVMYAFIQSSSSSANVSAAAAGWTLVPPTPVPVDFSVWCYRRVKQAGDVNPVWTLTVASSWTVDIVSYSDAEAAPDGSDSNVASATTTIPAGPLTPSVDNCTILAFGGVDASGDVRTWTTTGAMTERVDRTDNQQHRVVADELLSGGAGTPVSRDLTISGTTQDMASFMVLLKPAAVAGAPQQFDWSFG